MRLYVGNLGYNINADTLRKVFGKYGDVEEVSIITERETGESKGFAFLDMPNDKQAKEAIIGLNGSELDGRTIKVSEAKPRERREGRRAFGGGGRRY